MPMAAPYICSCGKVVPYGVTCECKRKLKRERDKRHDAKRPSARARGYDREWEEQAKAFLALPGNDRCVLCGAKATVVDHKRSIRSAPHLRMERANWQPMCRPCNSRKNARHEGGFGRNPQPALKVRPESNGTYTIVNANGKPVRRGLPSNEAAWRWIDQNTSEGRADEDRRHRIRSSGSFS